MSAAVPTVCRIVACFCPSRWSGPRPGVIYKTHGTDTPDRLVNVLLMLPPGEAESGTSTFASVPVHDAGEGEAWAQTTGANGWVEWPRQQVFSQAAMGQTARAPQ